MSSPFGSKQNEQIVTDVARKLYSDIERALARNLENVIDVTDAWQEEHLCNVTTTMTVTAVRSTMTCLHTFLTGVVGVDISMSETYLMMRRGHGVSSHVSMGEMLRLARRDEQILKTNGEGR